MTAPIRRTNPALTDSRALSVARRVSGVPAPDIATMTTGALDSPEVMASVRYWNLRWAAKHEADARRLRTEAQGISAEIASMTADASRCWTEYADLKDIRGGRPHSNPHYEGQFQWLSRHLPELERSIAHVRGDWTRTLAEARRHEASAVQLRAAALAELHG